MLRVTTVTPDVMDQHSLTEALWLPQTQHHRQSAWKFIVSSLLLVVPPPVSARLVTAVT